MAIKNQFQKCVSSEVDYFLFLLLIVGSAVTWNINVETLTRFFFISLSRRIVFDKNTENAI